MPKMLLEGALLGSLLCAGPVFAQSTCGNVQLQLASDYSFAIGSSSGGSAYAFTLGGQPLAQGSLKQLALFHYDGSLSSTSGIAPLKPVGTSFVPGKWGSALAIATGGSLSYPAPGNISFTDGTIELWIAPTKDGAIPSIRSSTILSFAIRPPTAISWSFRNRLQGAASMREL